MKNLLIVWVTAFTLSLMICGSAFAQNSQSGSTDQFISLDEAVKLTANFRAAAGPSAIKGGYFKKETIQAILDQPGCVGLRYYYGQKEDGTPVLILVGVDKNGNDLTDGLLAEFSTPCPPFCPENSPLIK